MKNIGLLSLGTTFLIMITLYFLKGDTLLDSPEKIIESPKFNSKQHEHWSIKMLSDSLVTLKKKELVFMTENSMKGTYIEIGKGASFQRKAADDDIYYLHKGTCTVKIGTQKKAFAKGDILYGKKGTEFILLDANEPLQLVIVSMKLSSNSAKPKWKHFSKRLIEDPRDSEENTWNPFIMYSNVMLGLYMLPHKMDGDGRLVHEWQELNIVTTGKSQFVMDSGTIDVEEGSIFFVEEGNGHYFDELEDDIDILILWEQRNVDHTDH